MQKLLRGPPPMSLTTYGANLLRELLPAARKGAVRRGGATTKAATTIAQDVAAFDAQIIAGLSRRDAVSFIAAFDAALRASNPEALARKYENMAKSPRRFMTGQPGLMSHDMRDM